MHHFWLAIVHFNWAVTRFASLTLFFFLERGARAGGLKCALRQSSSNSFLYTHSLLIHNAYTSPLWHCLSLFFFFFLKIQFVQVYFFGEDHKDIPHCQLTKMTRRKGNDQSCRASCISAAMYRVPLGLGVTKARWAIIGPSTGVLI